MVKYIFARFHATKLKSPECVSPLLRSRGLSYGYGRNYSLHSRKGANVQNANKSNKHMMQIENSFTYRTHVMFSNIFLVVVVAVAAISIIENVLKYENIQ